MPSRLQHSAHHAASPLFLPTATLFLLALPHLSIAATDQGRIIYPWDNGPLSANSYGAMRTTWGSQDCVNMSWVSSPSTPFQYIHLECNQGPNGTGPPWIRVWAFNSTSSSGNGSSLFCVANCNPSPPSSNTCRFVLDLASSAGKSPTDTAYSPNVSLNVMDQKMGEGATYPLPQWATTGATTTPTASTTSTSTSVGSSSASTPASSSESASGLNTGAKAGISVGVSAVCLIILACLGGCLFKRRQARMGGAGPGPAEVHRDQTHDVKIVEPLNVTPYELDGSSRPAELPTRQRFQD
ncbi:uncharacterized protein BBA_05366 [Beauveria bassiana ARSEF 2860]|uniref:Uncharacterized protein n=1 Tax=Beauveria bassiana (strain ARSEF 2860) TaxID=655819 RepID=J4ULM7_BEAB2|nr:uncharacterized protein BBA_05366 [Beauveria bassiana ARSEF 2860]EJP65497.1 hypothetical protein BBA_05366 [Beauveria bassiana ARSEF 2860]